MRVSRLRIGNYKSFRHDCQVDLEPGFNFIVGKNDSGKTALLEGLSFSIPAEPHRSEETATSRTMALAPPRLDGTIQISGAELKGIVSSQALGTTFSMQIPDNATDAPTYAAKLFEFETLEIDFEVDFGTNGLRINNPQRFYKYLNDPSATSTRYSVSPNRTINHEPHRTAGNDDLASALANYFRGQIFRFQAERPNIGQATIDPNEQLHPSCSNLPQVLHKLISSNPVRYDIYLEMVRRVLPGIGRITTPPLGGNSTCVLIWRDRKSERDDLAVPLTKSGSGVGQVLSIVYLLASSKEYSRTILIDEPSSFLHPGASRALMELLGEHPQHQYVIATHSPDLLRCVDRATITLVRKEGAASSLIELPSNDARASTALLDELGVRLSSIFGADKVLWVEGATEESVYRRIAQRRVPGRLGRTTIAAVLHTDDFRVKEADRVYRIYKKLSSAPALIPKAVGFLFDRETKTEDEIAKLKSKMDSTIEFLPRRMLENYLLHPQAIAVVLAASVKKPVTLVDVQAWLNQHSKDAKYYKGAPAEDFVRFVDAAGLLEDLFSYFSGGTVAFQKTLHSVAIADWLVENDPASLNDIELLLKKMLAD